MTAKKQTSKNRQTQSNPDDVKYLVNRGGGEGDFIVAIPPTWRLTFGYVNPAKSEDGYRRGDAHCLRIYEGEKLRAVMGNVTGFRDLSIPLAKKFEKESGETTWSQDSEGNFERNEKRELLESGFQIEEVEAEVLEP